MDQKPKPNHMLPQGDTSRSKDKYRLKMKGWKMIFQANGIQRKAGVTVLISDKTDFKIKKVKKILRDTS